MKYKFKNSVKNDFVINILLAIIAGMLSLIGTKMIGSRVGIVVFALAIALAFCRIAVEGIEKLIGGKFTASIIATVSVLLLFASQNFMAAALVAVVYSFSKSFYDLICSCFSEKLLEDDENKLSYYVTRNEEYIKVFAEDVQKDDVVKVARGEHLAFDYIYKDENEVSKNCKSGTFNLADEAQVTVIAPYPYEIDVAEFKSDACSESETIVKWVERIFCGIAALAALVLFALKIKNGADITDALYTLGVYLLFVNPLVFSSGVLHAGLFSLKNLKQKGVSLQNTSELETLSNVNKIYFTNEVMLDSETKVNEDALKAVKIANVLGIQTELLSDKNAEQTTAIVETVGFSAGISDCDSEKSECIIAEQVVSDTVVYVCEKDYENTKKVIAVNTKKTDKKSLVELVKATKSTKIYKWFNVCRATIGALINTAVIALYASGIGDKFLTDLLVETEDFAVTHEENFKTKIIELLLNSNEMAPWLICAIHLVLINLCLLVSLGFLNDNKKLR